MQVDVFYLKLGILLSWISYGFLVGKDIEKGIEKFQY